MKYQRILRAVMATPWAILPAKMDAILEFLEFQASGGKLSAEQIAAITAATPGQTRTAGNVQVLPFYGVVSQRMSADMAISGPGGVSTERFGAQFRAALNDPSVGSIVIDVDSPGGAVFGVQELADTIYKARGQKPVVAVANSLAASAAYWIATAADELVVTPGGQVGSIGVLTAHDDVSRMHDALGVTTTLISAGKYKVEGNPYEPLGDEARAALQKRVDGYYDAFTAAVARHRGVSASDVAGGFGEGRVVGAKEAKRLGMADRIATLDETVSRLAGGRSRSGTRAEASLAKLRLASIY